MVDDHSEDSTAVVGMKAGCTVMRSEELPEGWVGKTWACWQGARSAKGDLLLFLDADTVLEAGGLSRMVATYEERGGLFSVYPYHRMERPYEQLSAFFNLIAMAGTGAFTVLATRAETQGGLRPLYPVFPKGLFRERRACPREGPGGDPGKPRDG